MQTESSSGVAIGIDAAIVADHHVAIRRPCCGPGSLDSFHDYHAASSRVAAANASRGVR
jgi:hypothetical protein